MPVFLLWAATQLCSPNGPSLASNGRCRDVLIVSLESLSERHQRLVLEFLGEVRAITLLKGLVKSTYSGKDVASSIIVRYMDPAAAVDYCKSLRYLSVEWLSAVCSLRFHKKEHVIAYINCLASSRQPETRY